MGYTLIQGSVEEERVSKATAFAVTLEVTSDDEAAYPTKVFVFNQLDPDADISEARFQCVASHSQLIDYPEDEPAEPVEGVQQPYFRISSFSLVSRSPAALAAMVTKIRGMLRRLEEDLDGLTTLEEAAEG